MPGIQSYVTCDPARRITSEFVLGPGALRGAGEVVRYGLSCFAFLVKRRERLSLHEFADRIEEQYSASNPRTAAVLGALRSCQ